MSGLLPGGPESNGRDLAPGSAHPVWLADRMSQRVAISGASGILGGALSSYLVARGDAVRHLVRREARTGSEISWHPAERRLDAGAFEDVDAVVHLAGAGVGDRRWSPGYKQEILASRTDGTSTVASAVAAHGDRIRLVSASAVGWYGSDRGDEILTKQSPEGTGFLAEVAQAWEASTPPPAPWVHPWQCRAPDSSCPARAAPSSRWSGSGGWVWPVRSGPVGSGGRGSASTTLSAPWSSSSTVATSWDR